MTAQVPARFGLPREIAFLADHGIPPSRLRLAAQEAERVGVPVSRQVLVEGLIDEAGFYRALAAELGLPFETRHVTLVDPAEVSVVAGTGVARIFVMPGGWPKLALAPTGPLIAALLGAPSVSAGDAVIVTPTRLADAARRGRAGAIARAAASLDQAGLGRPSARTGSTAPQRLVACALLGSACFAVTLAPAPALAALGILFGVPLLAAVILRLACLFDSPPPTPPACWPAGTADRDLPIYTVCVPLFREEAVLPKLIAGLSAFDYPPARLDIKLLVEEVDGGMRRALAALALPAFISVLVVPRGQPQTKPRALNVALAEARGTLLTIFDAEDEPDPGQLRLAANRFLAADEGLACLQGRLVIDNAADGWLQRLFALEYAGLFDVINPGLMACGLPILLGGTSNHFRVAPLRRVLGWDAWNVTEDADIGVRLLRLGYRIGDLPSRTLEEAPPRLPVWIRQRTRWMKGYIQTLMTHLRDPAALVREAGATAAFGFLIITLGTVVSALIYPFGLVATALALHQGALLMPEGPGETVAAAVALSLLGGGAGAILLPPALGARRRGLPGAWAALPLLPVYYLLVSFATWRALVELPLRPFHWHKTAHGFARTSQHGKLSLSRRATDAAAIPPQPRPAGARC